MAKRVVSLVFVCQALGGACDSVQRSEVEGASIVVPETHPCPELALPGHSSSLWTELEEEGASAPVTLLIPLESEERPTVSQGNQQGPTHQDTLSFAWDFDVAESTKVLAAAPGVVVWVRDDSEAYGRSADALNDANWIVLDHGAGLFTSYVHLAPESAMVSAGQSVAAGTPLALTGLSGRMTGAHLHFQLENSWSQSLPATFVHREAPHRCDWVPVLGEVVGRAEGVSQDLVWGGQPSALPLAAFAEHGVLELHGLPARLMSRGALYEVSGRAAPGMGEVWVLILPEGGGDALLWEGLTVVDGRFAGRLSLGDLQRGRYGWAAVAVPSGESPFVTRSIRMSLVN